MALSLPAPGQCCSVTECQAFGAAPGLLLEATLYGSSRKCEKIHLTSWERECVVYVVTMLYLCYC